MFYFLLATYFVSRIPRPLNCCVKRYQIKNSQIWCWQRRLFWNNQAWLFQNNQNLRPKRTSKASENQSLTLESVYLLNLFSLNIRAARTVLKSSDLFLERVVHRNWDHLTPIVYRFLPKSQKLKEFSRCCQCLRVRLHICPTVLNYR